jgi:hypothetical protein
MKQSEATQIILTDLVTWARLNSLQTLTFGDVWARVNDLRGRANQGTDKHTAARKCAGTENLLRRANALLRSNI